MITSVTRTAAPRHSPFIGLLTSQAGFPRLQLAFAQGDESGARGALRDPSTPSPSTFIPPPPSLCPAPVNTSVGLGTPQTKWETEPRIRIQTYKRSPENTESIIQMRKQRSPPAGEVTCRGHTARCMEPGWLATSARKGG